jgi:hypothetical protein
MVNVTQTSSATGEPTYVEVNQSRVVATPTLLRQNDEYIRDYTLISATVLVSMLDNFFPSLLKMRQNKLECLYLAITFHTSLSFAGNTRSLPKKEAFERFSNWVGSGLALKF